MLNRYMVNLKPFRSKTKKNKKTQQKRKIKFKQSGGNPDIIDLSGINNQYNETQKYINSQQVKDDLQKLVDTYMKLESSYQDKKTNLMNDYQYHLQNNNQPQLISINHDLMNRDKDYHKNKNVIINQINHIRDYVKDNKCHFMEQLGIQKIEPTIETDSMTCPKCYKTGLGVMLIPEADNSYKCPVCAVKVNHNENMMVDMNNNLNANINPKSNSCLQNALQNPIPGMDVQTQIQQCMMQEKVSLDEIDVAYLKKHNELMTIYKAYQNLYKKVLEYKDKADNNVKAVRVHSFLSRQQLSKMVQDQDKIMSSIEKMQHNMVTKGVLKKEEVVNVKQFTGDKIQQLNNNLGNQIDKLMSTDAGIDNNSKRKILKMVDGGDFQGKLFQIA